MSPIDLTDKDFDTEIDKLNTPVLIDFWAPWCAPCKQMSPTLDQIAQTRGDALKVVKINVDENPEIAARFGIRALPTLMIFQNGAPVSVKFGMQSASNMNAWLDAEASS